MHRRIRKSSATKHRWWHGEHRFEHWYVDNCVYFITSRVRDRFPAFASEEAKHIVWNRFLHYCNEYIIEPWIMTLLDNHYHLICYVKTGEDIGKFMQRFHGSVSKLVNDLLPIRHLPFWRRAGNQDYFDGCLRDTTQLRRAYQYTLKQSQRHRIARDYRAYPHTRVFLEMDDALHRAKALNALLTGVPYARYEHRRKPGR